MPTRQHINRRNHDNYYFSGNRELAIQRDGEKCIKCGMTREEHRRKYGKDITVDHIDVSGSLPRGARNDDLSNLQTLCLGCHLKKDKLLFWGGRSHCPKGHKLIPENRRGRECRLCANDRTKRYRHINGISKDYRK